MNSCVKNERWRLNNVLKRSTSYKLSNRTTEHCKTWVSLRLSLLAVFDRFHIRDHWIPQGFPNILHSSDDAERTWRLPEGKTNFAGGECHSYEKRDHQKYSRKLKKNYIWTGEGTTGLIIIWRFSHHCLDFAACTGAVAADRRTATKEPNESRESTMAIRFNCITRVRKQFHTEVHSSRVSGWQPATGPISVFHSKSSGTLRGHGERTRAFETRQSSFQRKERGTWRGTHGTQGNESFTNNHKTVSPKPV